MNFWELNIVGEVACVSIVPNIPFTQESFSEYSDAYTSVYSSCPEFYWVFDTRNMATENVPEWFWLEQYKLTTSQRKNKKQVKGVCIILSSNELALLINTLLKLYDTDRPTHLTTDVEDAYAWLTKNNSV